VITLSIGDRIDLSVLHGGRLYFANKETLCLYWPLGTVVTTGPKMLDFYVGFCGHRLTCLKAIPMQRMKQAL
jgi:hypothetical protein